MDSDDRHAFVFIGVARRAEGSCPAFDECVSQLDTPPRTVYKQERGDHLPRCRNKVIRAGLASGAEWFFLLDDDTIFGPDVLRTLLAHQKDAVVGLCLKRSPPFQPLVLERLDEQGGHALFLTPHLKGLHRIAGCGLGGLLLRRSVLERIGDPWFTFGRHPSLAPDQYAEDLDFCRKLQAAEIPLYCDLETRFGHIFTAVAWPNRRQGQWETLLAHEQPFVSFPAVQHPLTVGVR